MSVIAAGRTVHPGPAAPAVSSLHGGGPGAKSAPRLGSMNPQFRELLAEITFAESGGSGALVSRRDREGTSPMHEEAPVAAPNMAPYFDHTPTTGTMCYVTGNTTDSTNVDVADVDGGKTSLTTPTLDLTGMAEPTIGYWQWFTSFHPIGTSSGHNGPDPSDYLAVLISNDNGANWTVVDTTRGDENHWEERTIRVADFVTPSAQVRVRFVAADLTPGTVVEAALDDFIVYDAALPNVGVPAAGGSRALALSAPRPDPARGAVSFTLELKQPGDALVEVLDVSGRRIRAIHRGAAPAGALALTWDGADESGRPAPAGLYWMRATGLGESVGTRFVRVR
jgi:hypothetical protein